MTGRENEKIQISNNFCTSDDDKITSILELNNIKIEDYVRNIRIEHLKCLRSIKTLNLNNFYLLYVYLKDIYYIFFHFIIHINEEKETLKEKEHIKNCFLYNTKIESFNTFLNLLKHYICKKSNNNLLSIEESNVILSRSSSFDEKNTETCVESGNAKRSKEVETEVVKDKIENYKNATINKHNNPLPCFDYTNEFLQLLYTKDQINFFNIDKLIYEKIKKDSFYENEMRISNNISIYKLSYLYYTDKLKRIRLDYIFHLILSKGLKNNTIKMKVDQNENANYSYINEQLFLLYISHLKYYIFSFFLYSHVKYIKSSTNKNNSTNQCEFLFNNEDNLKNLQSLISYIINFVNNILTHINTIFQKDEVNCDEERKFNTNKEKRRACDAINNILKGKFLFRYITMDHIDLILSYIVLLNICSQGYMQYYYFNNIYSNFFYLFSKYNTSIKLWKTLRSRNYFRFFEDLKELSVIERFCILFNLKKIRVDYLYSILYSANNKNKFSLSLKFIDECLHLYNLKRTTYLLNCLKIGVENERIYFNMSGKLSIGNKSRCVLLDNKNECLQNFFSIYEESIEDYAYIIYEEKTFDKKKCFSKFDIPKLICFC